MTGSLHILKIWKVRSSDQQQWRHLWTSYSYILSVPIQPYRSQGQWAVFFVCLFVFLLVPGIQNNVIVLCFNKCHRAFSYNLKLKDHCPKQTSPSQVGGKAPPYCSASRTVCWKEHRSPYDRWTELSSTLDHLHQNYHVRKRNFCYMYVNDIAGTLLQQPRLR